MNSFELFSIPAEIPASHLSGKVAIAVDILRAGTTIATALDSGASCVYPTVDIAASRARAREISGALLGGERGGLLIEGFDLSNSPKSYSSDVVAGRSIVFTTTNGTQAIEACRDAAITLVGSFANLAATSRVVVDSGRPVAIVCAGTDGQPTLEDILFGGALYQQLVADGWAVKAPANTSANAAIQMWNLVECQMQTGKSLYQILCETQGGKNLIALKLQHDIEFAAHRNRFDSVPIYDPASGSIRSDVDLHRPHG